MLIKIFLSA